MPGANRDDNSGKYTETYPSDAFISALEAEGGSAGTQPIADRVGCSYETAYKKLRSLADDGRIGQQKVGNANLWEIDNE
ncbi:hypothetical protein [Haloarcula sp. CBA1127]|uniref:hypothetical protein n=1 Tax=Haloarcula sp. CBA1127 TaxID=1765055 RepID=UPI00073E6B3A|nr:hypothetical protein [Haloarcula sp. CBA1127]